MPCYSPDDHPGFRPGVTRIAEDRRVCGLNLDQMEALACGLLRASERNGFTDMLYRVDWDAVGITLKQAEAWWKDHQKRDAERKAYEEERRAIKADKDRKDLERLLKKYPDSSRELVAKLDAKLEGGAE